MFPRRKLSKSCSECEVNGVRLLGMGFHDIQGLVLSHLWVPLLRASHVPFSLFVFKAYFFQTLYWPFTLHVSPS
jgi:hypothetical protein